MTPIPRLPSTAPRKARLSDLPWRSWVGGGSSRSLKRSGAARLLACPAVAQADRAVEHQMPRRAVGVAAEIAEPLELHRRQAVVLGDGRLEAAVPQHFEGVGVDVGHQIAGGAGIGPAEQ